MVPIFRAHDIYQIPECGRVIHMPPMRDLMGHDIIQNGGRSMGESPVEGQIAF